MKNWTDIFTYFAKKLKTKQEAQTVLGLFDAKPLENVFVMKALTLVNEASVFCFIIFRNLQKCLRLI